MPPVSSNASFCGSGINPCAILSWDQNAADWTDLESSLDFQSTLDMVNTNWESDMEMFQFGHAPNMPCSELPVDLSSFAIPGTDSERESCRYPCLNPVLPLLKGIMTPEEACYLLEVYFADLETAPSKERCPYVLSPVLRATSVLRQTNPRPVSPALLMIILWCVAHTGALDIFPDAGSRVKAKEHLYFLGTSLLQERENHDVEGATGK